jgi:hypothetical protein
LRRSIEEEADSQAVSELFSICPHFLPAKTQGGDPHTAEFRPPRLGRCYIADYGVLQLARSINSCVPCDFIQFQNGATLEQRGGEPLNIRLLNCVFRTFGHETNLPQ